MRRQARERRLTLGAFVLRRVMQAIPVLILSSIAVFALIRLAPGDPAFLIAGPDATPEQIAIVRREMGLDQPQPVQYLIWLSHILQGDLGRSYINGQPVARLVTLRIPATIELTLAAMLLTPLLALPTGVLAAVRRGGPVDWVITSVNGVLIAVPNFWLGILAILVFALGLGWLPPGGRVEWADSPPLALRALILPAFTLSLQGAASLSRIVRAVMLEVLADDYVRTARAKGLAESTVVWRHAFRNALVPIITVLGLQFGRLLGGAVVIESVFTWPGLGRLTLDAISGRDYTVLQATLLLIVSSFLIVNLLLDVLYGLADPRVRVAQRSM